MTGAFTRNDASPALVEAFTLGPFATNCYIVREPAGAECWIVDASFEPGAMIERVQALSLRVAAIVLTHAHVDHVAGLGEVKAAFREAPILIHAAERDWPADPMLNLSAAMGEPVSAPAPDRLLEGGEDLTLGASRWRVIHTPGHSPGGITLHCAEAGTAIVGDTLFADSIGRFDLPGGDEKTLLRSIRELLYTLPDDTVALPGHGPSTTIGREKRSNPYVRG